ncbi:MAG: SCP2 sterol-binding domain-containing protein [Thermoplasmatota archaeon]
MSKDHKNSKEGGSTSQSESTAHAHPAHGHGGASHGGEDHHAAHGSHAAQPSHTGHPAQEASHGAAHGGHATGHAKKYHDLEQVFHRIETAYHERYPTNEKLRKAVKGKTRKIHVKITDGRDAGFVIENEKLHRVEPHGLGKPDIVLEASTHDILALFNKELAPLEAFLRKKVKVHASMSDLLLAKSFLG